MKLRPEDPMRTSATDSGPNDGWRGARIGAEIRDRQRRAMLRVQAAVDVGEPGRPVVTIAFLVLTLAATFAEFAAFGASPTTSELGRAGGAGIGALATGATWKLLTANLLHANLIHVGMNAFIIYLTGRWLEHLVGGRLVAATILWSALATNVGAMFIDVPSVGIGASGVAFGLIGCSIAVDPRAKTAIGVIARQLAIFNIIATFVVPGISIGGHLGGLTAGLLVGWIGWSRKTSEERPAGQVRGRAAVLAIVAALPLVALLAIGPRVLPDEARGARGDLVAPLVERRLNHYEVNGNRIDQADCEPDAANVVVYRCTVDGVDVVVRFSRRDDQLSIGVAE
jgi:membrane associated rhomboid family serine protease